MVNYTKEVVLMFIGCVIIIASSNGEDTNFTLMGVGVVVVTVSIVLFIKSNKKQNKINKEQKDGKKDS